MEGNHFLSGPRPDSEPACLTHLLQAEVAGDKVRAAEAGEHDRDDDPEADDAHDDGRPLRHGQVQLGPPSRLKVARLVIQRVPRGKKKCGSIEKLQITSPCVFHTVTSEHNFVESKLKSENSVACPINWSLLG